ncbi:thioredoxin-disulfide reductase [Candidatus Woesearchaeota archaeon]|jgi:thioredoxin reductase (NADPH)|nr:thioredoxin-disulfide reductase [Candidatus Woesearchaeota archaeon]MBT6041770.1 thioredoxin-disulfide reductase [Candidatus Woesearchaeota archaeon]MBT6336694.1 thioredoxin-disulfide reductase [Candidatus Woesearchaeota archaeon]MBT7927804.1 thioredoxin-disulfide reductase [Candidatus Woesearchaeota archaeon]
MENVIIIGGGPAGYTAAIYASRADLKPVLFEGSAYGGQLMTTSDVDNFPGFPDSIMGPELMEKMRAQAKRFGTNLIQENITKVDFSKKPFTIFAGDKKYQTKTVIIATGADHRKLGIESEKKLAGKGVSYCATCDGFFFKDKDIMVIGGGDSAIEEATFLTKFAKSVNIVHRRDELRASKFMQEKAFANKKIKFVWDSAVEEILGENAVEGIKVKNLKTEKTSEIKCQGVFVAIGHIPNTKLFDGQIKLDKGYIITGSKDFPKSTQTSIEGVYAAGDVQDHYYRQAITSAATGCMAAIEAERYLQD